jgi:mevalonate kinase
MKTRRYPSKILLFGEYAIIRGSRALAAPFPEFGGEWARSERYACSELEGLCNYLKENGMDAILDLEAFEDDIAQGQYFDSGIPMGYGLGSSGALVAAVYDKYARKPEAELSRLKAILASMEGYFHGASSGLDPLVCLLNLPILVKSPQETDVVNILPRSAGSGTLFLLDTGISRETGPLVRIFLSKCEDLAFDARVEDELGSLSNAAIRAYLEGDWQVLRHIFGGISQFQWQYFQEMIPEAFRDIWARGLDSPVYKLKLCGAGGGGFLMGFAPEFNAACEALKGHKLLPI